MSIHVVPTSASATELQDLAAVSLQEVRRCFPWFAPEATLTRHPPTGQDDTLEICMRVEAAFEAGPTCGDPTYNRRALYRAICVVRGTKRGWDLDTNVKSKRRISSKVNRKVVSPVALTLMTPASKFN